MSLISDRRDRLHANGNTIDRQVRDGLVQLNQLATAAVVSPGRAWQALMARRRQAARAAERTTCTCRMCRDDTNYKPCVGD